MRMFLYYAAHSFVNQLRKLLKTWVLIFILVCTLIGGVVGLGTAALFGDEEAEDIQAADIAEQEDEEALFEAEIYTPPISGETVLELIAGAVVLAVLAIELLGADKNGARIFLPADVSLLFASPMRPQTVLLFRLGTQMGVSLFASIYILFQLPNMIGSWGLSAWAALAIVLAWALTIMLGKLVQVLAYLLCAAHPGFKRSLSVGVYLALGLILAGFALFYRTAGLGFFEALPAYFNAPHTRYIPVWGWVKGLCVFAARGETLPALLCIAACLACGGLLWLLISRIRADFYEDAMNKSEELAEAMARAQRDGAALVKRKKDRSDRLRRDSINRGWGANVFFFKTLYNRFRFARLGYFTKTAVLYLIAGAGLAAFCRFALQSDELLLPAAALLALAFFRSLRDPLREDTDMAWFLLVPESMYKKLLWSLLGGTANCALDVLPGMLAAVLIQGAPPLTGLAWLLAIASIEIFSTSVSTFINVSVNVPAGKTIKQLVQILFMYFGLIPDAAILIIGFVSGYVLPAAAIAAAFNVGAALLFLLFSSLVLEP